jgi:beta-galactosidase
MNLNFAHLCQLLSSKTLAFKLIVFILLSSYTFSFAQRKTRVNTNWEFLKGDLGGVWEAVRPFKAGGSESVPLQADCFI